MQIGTILVIMVLTYYVKYITDIVIFKDKRKKVIEVNNELNELRKIPIKTLEEQKAYINLKYPQRTKFSWRKTDIILTSIAMYILIYFVLYALCKTYNINISLGWGIFFLFVGPILINYILNIFNISKDDTLNYQMRGWFGGK